MAELRPVQEITAAQLLEVLLRRRLLIIGLPLALAMAIAFYRVSQPRTYTSIASFIPQAETRLPVAGIAAQFGLMLPGSESSQSPAFYAELLQSDEILRAVARTRFSFEENGHSVSGSIADLYRLRIRDSTLREASAIDTLRQLIRVSRGRETGLVRIQVTARWGALAQQIAMRLLELVSDFNMTTRRSRASAERQFIEGRLAAAKEELRGAEDRLQRFLVSNRNYSNSPGLMFDRDRMLRDIQARQQVLTSITQSYEQARIEEVRNTPLVTLVDRPQVPARPDPRGLLPLVSLTFLLASLIGIFVAIAVEYLHAIARETADVEGLSALRRRAFAQVRHPWQTLKSLMRP